MTDKKSQKKSKNRGNPTDLIVVYGSDKPTLTSVFEWGKYHIVEQVMLEKKPKKIREKETFYD